MDDEDIFEYYDEGDDADEDVDIDDDEDIDAQEEGEENEEGEEGDEEIDVDETDITDVTDIIDTESDVMDLKKVVDKRKKMAETPLNPPDRMTKYEVAALIGFRAQQIAEGAPPYVVVYPGMDPIAIAIDEFHKDLIPLMIERPFPSNKIGRFKYESYKLDELINVMPI